MTSDNSVLLCTIRARLFAQTVMQVWCYRVTVMGTPITEFQAGADVAAFMVGGTGTPLDGWIAMATADVQFVDAVGQHVYPTRAAYSVATTLATGSVAGTALAANQALAATKRSTVAGRQGHGTVHYAGCPSSFYSSGRVTTAATTAFVPVPPQALANFTDSGGTLYSACIYHRISPALSPVTTTLVLESTTRTQRRRTVGLGI